MPLLVLAPCRSGQCIKILKHVWAERSEKALAKDVPVFTIGRLVNMDWKLGISMSSSMAKSVGRTFVAVEVTYVCSPHTCRR